MILHRYFLKQYNNRWFLFGRNIDATAVTNIALNRIEKIHTVSANYLPKTEIDFEEYFEGQKVFIQQGIIAFKVDESKIDVSFLIYKLNSDYVKEQVRAMICWQLPK